MPAVRVIVHGAMGKMGREILAAFSHNPDFEPVGAVDIAPGPDTLPLPDGKRSVPYATSLKELLTRCKADVVVDFSNASACRAMAQVAAASGLNLVIGTTGLNDNDLKTLEDLSHRYQVGIFAAPNFALGAVVLNHLVHVAARFFDYAEIFEAHHEAKIDAPSGTALGLARAIASEKKFTRLKPEVEPVSGTRGGEYNGVSIHSARMPGRLAHHEVLFGIAGQTLSLRHDTLSRECYMPGIILAAKEVVKQKGHVVVGLDKLLGIS